MSERNLGKCVWSSEDIYDAGYNTACGNQWDAETSDMEFCPFCAGSIERENGLAVDGEVEHE